MLASTDGFVTAYGDFLKAIQLDPNDSAALEGLIRAAAATARQAETLTTLDNQISRHPAAVPLYIAASKLAASSGSVERAVDFAERGSAIAPPHPEALEQLASIYADVGDAQRLDSAVGRLRRERPEGARTWYFTAASKFLRGELPEAAESVQGAIARDPSSQAYNLLGAIEASRGRAAEARQAFDTALALDPRDSATYTNLGVLQLNSAQPETAAGFFAEALTLDPDSQQALNGLAEARSRSRP
jgi:tetratricopeptide (TPR) repeat protein